MNYQLTTEFIPLEGRAGVLENQSVYAVLEYVTSKTDTIPQINTGIRIHPGEKFRFSLPKDVSGFVRFLYVRQGDYTRQIAVVEEASVYEKEEIQEVPKLRLVVSDIPQEDENIIWGDIHNETTEATATTSGEIQLDNLKVQDNPQGEYWGDTKN